MGAPSKDNMSDLDLWKKANTKPNVNVAPTEAANSLKTTEYVVKGGDTLGAISYKYYGIASPAKISRIQTVNKLKTPDDLQIGQKLVIPIED